MNNSLYAQFDSDEEAIQYLTDLLEAEAHVAPEDEQMIWPFELKEENNEVVEGNVKIVHDAIDLMTQIKKTMFFGIMEAVDMPSEN